MFSKVNELVARYATKVSEHNKKRKDKIKMRLTEELWTFLSKNDFYISLWSNQYKLRTKLNPNIKIDVRFTFTKLN